MVALRVGVVTRLPLMVALRDGVTVRVGATVLRDGVPMLRSVPCCRDLLSELPDPVRAPPNCVLRSVRVGLVSVERDSGREEGVPLPKPEPSKA